MLWDIANTLFEFINVFFIFHFLTNNPIKWPEIFLYSLGSIGLSVYFCIDIPHYVLINVVLFILLQFLCFYHTELRHRLFASIISVFLTLSLELMLLSLLPESLLHTFLGDSIINILLILFTVTLYFCFHRHSLASELNKLTYRFRYPVIILRVFWSFLTQRYQTQLSTIWKYLPGLISLGMFILFLGAAFFYLHMQRSAEHQKIVSYESHLSDINSYLEAIRKENHDYKHQIRHLYDRIATSSSLSSLKENLLPYIDSLDVSTEIPDTILSVDNTMMKALLYGAYLRCQKGEITFSFETTDTLPAFPIEDYLLVQILENLLSNAIEHNLTIPESTRRFVHIELSTDSHTNRIVIENAASNMDMSLSDFFKSGYSTKTGSHQGLGLTNTRQILSEHNISFYGKKNENKCSIEFTLLYVSL